MECMQEDESVSLNTVCSDHKLEMSPVPESRRPSQDPILDLSSPPLSASLPLKPLSPKPSPSSAVQEAKVGKRVRKLKKKRSLRKAQGSEQPDISDSELDIDQSSRPVRKIRTRRRPSGSLPAPVEKDESMEVAGALDSPLTKEPTPAPAGKEAQDTDSSDLEMMELPQAVATEVVNLETSDPDEGVQEDMSPAQISKQSASLKTRAQNLACNEVSSTSEIDTSNVVKSCERLVVVLWNLICYGCN